MKKVLVVGVVLVVAIAGILWALSPDKSLKVHQPQPVQAEQRPWSFSPTRRQSNSTSLEIPDELNISTCEPFVQTYDERYSRWLRDRYEGWTHYIDNGYSLDAVTLTIEHFLNLNFAASFRADYLRARTDIGQNLQLAQDELERQNPEVRGAEITFVLAPPSQAYSDLVSMSISERQELVSSQSPSLEDIAYFMHKNELSDEDIILLLTEAENLQRVVHYRHQNILSILDHAIISGRLAVVQTLLEQGVRPSEDTYLGSSMEHALARLFYSRMTGSSDEPDCCPREADAAAIVILMQQYGSKARFKAHDSAQVMGEMPGHIYQFDADTMTRLRQRYGLDLTDIEVRQEPSKAEARPLIDKIAAELTDYLADNTDAQQLESKIEHCRELSREFYRAWQQTAARDLMLPILEQYAENPSRIEEELAAIDPGLVDVFRAQQRRLGRVRLRYPLDSDAERSLRDGDPEPAIQFIQALDIDSQDKMEYALHLLSWNVEYLHRLISSAILPTRPDYFLLDQELAYDINRLKQLESLGLDLRAEDSVGQTLLHIAVKNGRADLVSELVAEGFPFGGRGLNQDPLHAALNPSNRRLPIQTMEPIVRELMSFQPEVDIFHHRRLAVMQLKYPDVYQALVADFPELEVPEGTELMPVRL
ncbi:MAG: hypothetical protein C0463_07005 [Idiomarina sp.]|nr:hypothetical protein [Idiomarina sp.]